MARDYFIQNWSLILISLAFLVSLRTTAFLDKTFSNRMCLLIASVLLLSVVVFFEFYFSEHGIVWKGRPYLTAVRYSAMPFVDALILYTLVKKLRKTLFIPACILSIWNGWIFRFEEDGTFVRGPLGLLPFIVPGTYGSVLVYTLYKRSNKQSIELIPIAYFAFALGSGVFLPFIFGPVYSHIFCTTIAIGLFTYYLFSVLNLTKKDSLTDLLNRQACYGDMEIDPSGITALVSIDMNGLKHINDTHGHVLRAGGQVPPVRLPHRRGRVPHHLPPRHRGGGPPADRPHQKERGRNAVQLRHRLQLLGEPPEVHQRNAEGIRRRHVRRQGRILPHRRHRPEKKLSSTGRIPVLQFIIHNSSFLIPCSPSLYSSSRYVILSQNAE